MTRLKVVNTLTNSTYYLNNVDVSCAKQYSFIGKTDNNNNIVHIPSSNLEYSTDYSYKTDVDKLNALYNHDLSADFSGYFPANHGIILSELLIKDKRYKDKKFDINKLDCSGVTKNETTYWCPPVSSPDRGSVIQETRVISFSYIHKNFLQRVWPSANETRFMIYDNTTEYNVYSDKLLGIYPGAGGTDMCVPDYYCSSGAIGVCFNSKTCEQQCYKKDLGPCIDYNDFNSFIAEKEADSWWPNELIIKSWNYNPDSNMSDRGIIYDASMDKWVAQTPNPKSPWGWNDVPALSKNENIPLLAFGITIPDVLNPSPSDISNIKHLYADLSNNIEPSFNEYCRNSGYPLMPYHIGLDVSCLTRPDCSNPFFDLSLILNFK